MPKFTVPLVTALALAGLSLGNPMPVSAQAPQILPAADTQSEPITEAADLPEPGQDISESDANMAVGYPGAMGYPYLANGGNLIRRGKEWYGYQDQGPWMRPVRRPIHRVPVQYARYWPTSYYTGGYNPRLQYSRPLPMVYQPTDTTQLGFTYQRVPQWQPRPGAIPGAPWPPNWHYVIPTRYGTYNPGEPWCDHWNSHGHGNAYGQYCPEEGYSHGTPQQAHSGTAPETAAPAPEPVPVPEDDSI